METLDVVYEIVYYGQLQDFVQHGCTIEIYAGKSVQIGEWKNEGFVGNVFHLICINVSENGHRNVLFVTM